MSSFLKQGRSEGGQWEEGKEAEGGGRPGSEGGGRPGAEGGGGTRRSLIHTRPPYNFPVPRCPRLLGSYTVLSLFLVSLLLLLLLARYPSPPLPPRDE